MSPLLDSRIEKLYRKEETLLLLTLFIICITKAIIDFIFCGQLGTESVVLTTLSYKH